MSYACPSWFHSLDVAEDGETVDDIFDQRTCTLIQDAYATIDSDDGSVMDYELVYGGDIHCNEHDKIAREYDLDAIIDSIDGDTDWYMCLDDETDCRLVFPNEVEYNRHRHEQHGEGEDEDEEDGVTRAPLAATATRCQRAHPPISPTQRKKIAEFIQRRNGENNPTYDMLLVPLDGINDTVMHTQWTDEPHLRSLTHQWPHHIIIHRDDPHVTSPSGKTSHTAWAA